MRKCLHKGCDVPAGKGFRYCGYHIASIRGRRRKATVTEPPIQETVDADSVCYCGYAGIDSEGCACGKACETEGCDNPAMPQNEKLSKTWYCCDCDQKDLR